jgi:RNA polymerase sigma factor (sigma-70 family)
VARKSKDPESICQEVWQKIIDKRDSFDGKSFSGWSFTILRNFHTEQVRKAARRDERELNPEYDTASDFELFGLAKLEKQEMIDVIKSCIESVGEPFVTAFRLKLGGASTRAISEKVGTAEKTVSTRVHRAKKMIQQCVEAKLA